MTFLVRLLILKPDTLQGNLLHTVTAKVKNRKKHLKKHGAKDENILVKTVPGSFELTFGANQLIEYSEVDAVIANAYRRSIQRLIRSL